MQVSPSTPRTARLIKLMTRTPNDKYFKACGKHFGEDSLHHIARVTSSSLCSCPKQPAKKKGRTSAAAKQVVALRTNAEETRRLTKVMASVGSVGI